MEEEGGEGGMGVGTFLFFFFFGVRVNVGELPVAFSGFVSSWLVLFVRLTFATNDRVRPNARMIFQCIFSASYSQNE